MPRNNKGSALSGSFLNSKVSGKELLARLRTLHEELSELSQEEEDRSVHKNIKVIAGQLVGKRFLGNVDKDVRAYVACCIVDIIRIYVPESPFSSEELCEIFSVIASLFLGFGTNVNTSSNTHGSRLLYILQSLSSVRSSVLMVYLSQQAVPRALDTLRALFSNIINSIRQDHDEEVSSSMAAILQACIEEWFDGADTCFDQELMDSLLLPLLPASRQENPASYALCQSVLSHSSSLLQNSITQFINGVLVGNLTDSPSDYESRNESLKVSTYHISSSSSELAEHVYSLIFELHKISSSLLLRILPNVCIQLQAEEETTRLRAVKLLGRLFASPLANYAQDYQKNFKDFLGRFVDISADVRKEMVECGYMVLKHKSHVAPAASIEVEDCVCQRLRDTEWEVRYQALARLLDLVVEENGVAGPINVISVTSLHTPSYDTVASSGTKEDRRGYTLREMAERMKDKKIQIRKIAMIGLAKVYWKHCAILLRPIDCGNDVEHSRHESGSGVPEEVWQRLSFIPGFILNCWGYPDPEERRLVLQLVQEQIIPKPPKKTSSEDLVEGKKRRVSKINEESRFWECRRATALLTMYRVLDKTQKQCLNSLLAFKSKTRFEFENFLSKWGQELSQQRIASGKKPALVSNPILHRAMLRLQQHFPVCGGANLGKKQESKSSSISFETLFVSKDKSIRKLLLQSIEYQLPDTTSRSSTIQYADRPLSEITRACQSRDDLKARLDSKSPLAQYIGSLYDASATYMLLNVPVVETLLNYVTRLCGAMSEREGNAKTNKASSGAAAALQDDAEIVCQLLVTIGKHSPRSFSDSADYMKNWLCAICSRSAIALNRRPSLWRDAVLSYFHQILKSIKCFLTSPEIEDAVRLRLDEDGERKPGVSQDDIRESFQIAQESGVSSLCACLAQFAVGIGESQSAETGEVDSFLEKYRHKMPLDDLIDKISASELGAFANPLEACSLLAECISAIVDGISSSDGSPTSLVSSRESVLRRQIACDVLGVSETLRFILSSMLDRGGDHPSKSKTSKRKRESLASALLGNVEVLPLDSICSRLFILAPLLSTFAGSADKKEVNKNILDSALFLVQNELLGSGTGHNCGVYLSDKSTAKLTSHEEREPPFFHRDAESNSSTFISAIGGALKTYTALAKLLESQHELQNSLSSRKRLSRQSNKSAGGHSTSLITSPFRDRLEEEYEMIISEEVDAELLSQSSLEERFPASIADLITYLLSIIRSQGTFLDNKRRLMDQHKSTQRSAAILREVAGKCLLQLLTLKRVNKNLLPSEWLSVAYLFLDEDSHCRQSLLAGLCSLMQVHCVHPRFLALTCLAFIPVATGGSATGHEANFSTVQGSLLFALKRLRCTHEALCAQVMSISASLGDPNLDENSREALLEQSKKLQRTAEDNTPEGIFPYVLYILSQPMAFPSADMESDHGRKQADSLARSLSMAISVLVKSSRNSSGDNISLLLKQADVIARFYQDRLIVSGSSRASGSLRDIEKSASKESLDRLNAVALIAQLTLTSQIKTQDNIQPYLGDINLPMDLFELKPSVVKVMKLSDYASAVVEHVYPNALLGSGGVEKAVGVSATSKPRGKETHVRKKPKALKKPRIVASSKLKNAKKNDVVSSTRRASGSRSRGGRPVNYADTRDSDDEEEMEEIEEVLSSQTKSSSQVSSSQSYGRLSSGLHDNDEVEREVDELDKDLELTESVDKKRGRQSFLDKENMLNDSDDVDASPPKKHKLKNKRLSKRSIKSKA